MAGDGLYWYMDPGVIGQKFTAHSKRMGPLAGDIVRAAQKEAVKFMQEAVKTRGVYQGMPTGGPRIQTWDMYNSIDGKTERSGDKTRAQFGFIRDAPYYTAFQERGTARTGWGQGIAPMHAFADAQQRFVDKMEDEFQSANIWENF